MLRDAFLSEVKKTKKFFFNTVVAQAQKIEFTADKVVFTFAPQHATMRAQLERSGPWLETMASQLAGRKIAVAAAEGVASPGESGPESSPPPARTGSAASPAPAAANQNERATKLKERALSDPGVQTMLDVFGGEIKDVEEKEA